MSTMIYLGFIWADGRGNLEYRGGAGLEGAGEDEAAAGVSEGPVARAEHLDRAGQKR